MQLRRIAALIFATAGIASAQTILVDDQFIDNGVTNGSDALDIAWFTNGSGASLTTASDNSTGPNEGVNDNAMNVAVGGQGFRGAAGNMTTAANLSATGHYASLRLDIRYTSNPANVDAGFRFGLFNSNGTTVAANSDLLSDNDIGYAARFSIGTATANVGLSEKASGTGGSVSGGNVSILSSATANVTSLNGTTNYYRLQLDIVRNGSNGLDFTISEGVNTTSLTPVLTFTDNSAATFVFDSIVLSNGNTVTDYRVDNILVTTGIPEPSTAVALLAGFGAFALIRRRRA
jgi:hypothetical protein